MHILRCDTLSGSRTYVHDAVVREVAAVVRDSTLGSAIHTDARHCREYFPQRPPTATSEHRVPDVVFVHHTSRERECLDVTVRRPAVHHRSGAAALAAQKVKLRHYLPWMRQRGGGTFTPLAIETYGTLAPDFQRFLRRAGRHHVQRLAGVDSEDPPEEPMTYLFTQRIVVQLMRAQAHEFRELLLAGGVRDSTLQEDQSDMTRLEVEADVEGAPTLEDIALVQLEG